MFFIGILLALSALLISYMLFSPSVALAKALKAIDTPNARKMHSKPIPRLGGFSFFVAFSISLIISPIDVKIKISIILGGTTVFLLGLFDDAVNLSPFTKLIGQILSGILYVFLTFGATEEIQGKLFSIISLFWIVFIINATNLCDGLDGLAGGITGSQALCLSVISFIFGCYDVFLCSILLLFAILGFLPRNIPPAKIFMGDCGSLFLGFVLSVLSVRLIYETQNIFALPSTLLIFIVPSADTMQSFTRRALKRRNPFSADRGHFHHKLIDLGFTKECAALMLISASLLFGLCGIVISLIKGI